MKNAVKQHEQQDDKYERDNDGYIVAERPEIRLIPGHHTGFGRSGNGYELRADGSYCISPGFRDSFSDIQAQFNAADHILESVQDHAHELLAEASKRRNDWFAMVAKNLYRSDEVLGMSYDPANGIITFKGKPVAANKELEDRIEIDKAGAGKEGA